MTPGFVPWPEEFARRYRERGYWAGVALGDALAASVARHADRVAVVDGSRRVTYAELGALSDRLALRLAERGIARGRVVVFQLPNVLEFVVAYVACLKVGAIPLCCLPAHRDTEISYLARFSEAAAWIIPTSYHGYDYAAMAARLRPDLPAMREIFVLGDGVPQGMTSLSALLDDPIDARVDTRKVLDANRPAASDVAVFQLSGGTTALPKIIPRTHDDYRYNSLAFAAITSFTESTVFLVSVPAAHNFPLACPGLQGALLLGARVVMATSGAPDVVFPIIERERVTWAPAVPATVIQWANNPDRARFDLGSLQTIYVGGQRLQPAAARAANEAFGPVVQQVFGMAEGLLCATRRGDPVEVTESTQGRPMSADDEIRIVGDDGAEVAPGEIGELLVRGPYTIRGYFNAPEHNAAAFTADGFYRTGDLVRLHPSGNLVVEGRRKDVINRGGEKISAEEVESLIVTHPAVLNAAVVAMPDPVLGERGCAFVTLRPGASLTLRELGEFLRLEKRVAAFKLPERLEIRERLPQTPVGKVSKKSLRAELDRILVAAEADKQKKPSAS